MGKSGNALFKKTTPIKLEVVDDQTSLELIETQPPEFSSVNPLSKKEKSRLAELEHIVDHNIQAAIDAWFALREINQRELYRETHRTFADYVNDNWDLARRTAYKYIEAADVIENVRNCAQIENVPHGAQNLDAPQNERQARELSKYTPEEQLCIWSEAVQSLEPGQKMSASHIRITANNIKLNSVKKTIKKAKKKIEGIANVHPEFAEKYQAFLDAIYLERKNDWKRTDRQYVISAIRDVLNQIQQEK